MNKTKIIVHTRSRSTNVHNIEHLNKADTHFAFLGWRASRGMQACVLDKTLKHHGVLMSGNLFTVFTTVPVFAA